MNEDVKLLLADGLKREEMLNGVWASKKFIDDDDPGTGALDGSALNDADGSVLDDADGSVLDDADGSTLDDADGSALNDADDDPATGMLDDAPDADDDADSFGQ